MAQRTATVQAVMLMWRYDHVRSIAQPAVRKLAGFSRTYAGVVRGSGLVAE